MSIYSKIDRRIRLDAKVVSLSPIPPCGQGLLFLLLCNEHQGPIPGLYCAGEAMLAETFGWTLEGFRKAFAEVSAKGIAKADWKARLLWLPNAIKRNAPQSPNVVLGWASAWDQLPECELKAQAHTGLSSFFEGLGKGFREAFDKACPKPCPIQEQDQEQEQEQEKKAPKVARPSVPLVHVKEVFEHWCAAMKSPRSKLDATRRSRIEWGIETYGLADCLRAIDGCAKSDWNMGRENGKKNNGIELIFRNADKFERFLAMAPKPKPVVVPLPPAIESPRADAALIATAKSGDLFGIPEVTRG